jgi:uncharacterized protein YqhQ
VTHERRGVARWPLFRGVASLVESLRLGSEALRFSADRLTEDLEAEDRASRKVGGVPTALLGALSALGLSIFTLATTDEVRGQKGEGKRDARSPLTFMLVIALAFFIALPQGVSAGINKLFGLGLAVQSPGFQLLTGALKLTIVVGYLCLIRRIPDIRRVFQYHGAEHKTISTYESREPLEVVNARAKTTLHPRCGTTFLVMIALVSIAVFTAIGTMLPRIQTGSAVLDNLVFFLEKLPFLPVIAAVTFELQRVFARFCTSGPLRVLLWPGFLVQRITTIEPDDDQLEVALAALRATLFREESADRTEASALLRDVSFPSYEAIATAERLRAAEPPDARSAA